ncbi:unnamed protein product [Closterium sp. Yama58-4]|nr:unnamed protein product [Closterium sp. Yama58-4]
MNPTPPVPSSRFDAPRILGSRAFVTLHRCSPRSALVRHTQRSRSRYQFAFENSQKPSGFLLRSTAGAQLPSPSLPAPLTSRARSVRCCSSPPSFSSSATPSPHPASPSSPSFPPSHSPSPPSSAPLHPLPHALSPTFRPRSSSPPPSPPSPRAYRAPARASPFPPAALPASAHAAPSSGPRAETQDSLGKVTGSGRGGSERSWVRGKGVENDGRSGADSGGIGGESGRGDGANRGENFAQRGRAQANGGLDSASDASDAGRRGTEGNGSLAHTREQTTGFRERADRTNEESGESLGAGGSGSMVRARKEWKAYEGVDRSQLRKRRKGKQIAEEAERGWGVGEESVDRVVERVMRLNFWDDVDGVLNRWSGRKNRKLFLPLIKAVSAHGDLRMALKVFAWMKAQRCYRAQPPIYSHLIHLAARSRKVNRARELFREMLEWR